MATCAICELHAESTFKVEGMDCREEVALIERRFKTLAGVEAFFHGLPANVWRAKGFMSVDGRPVLVQFSVGQLETAPAEPRALRHMVFIGRDMDRPAIEKDFGALLSRLGEGAAQARARGGRR